MATEILNDDETKIYVYKHIFLKFFVILFRNIIDGFFSVIVCETYMGKKIKKIENEQVQFFSGHPVLGFYIYFIFVDVVTSDRCSYVTCRYHVHRS